jgi:heparosan-N-sulfate-glucuronate 5-epimerase
MDGSAEIAENLSRRSDAGFFSSASSFFLPVGSQIVPGAVRGYYIDMRVKVDAPSWPPEWLPDRVGQLHVDTIQWGLGCHERHLAGDGDEWLAAAVEAGEHLLREQERDGPLAGGWMHLHPYKHTYPLNPPWLSSMAQGEGASLLVRLHLATGDDRFAEAALLALQPLRVPTEQGGTLTLLGGRPFPEEYPTLPPACVLNGAIFTMWGLYDVGAGLGDERAAGEFSESVDTLVRELHRWDTGYWSRYDLFPHPVLNPASSFYHALHCSQLDAMHRLAPREELAQTRARWEGYAADAWCRRRAFARKALFRLAVPRNKLLARRLPWSARPPA